MKQSNLERTFHFHFPNKLPPTTPAYVSNTTTNKSANILDPVCPSCICHAMYHKQVSEEEFSFRLLFHFVFIYFLSLSLNIRRSIPWMDK